MTGGPFPDDDLRRSLRRLVRLGGLLEPHSHHHAGLHMSLSEMMALGELADVESMSQQELGQLLGLEKSTVSRLVVGLQHRAGSSVRGIPRTAASTSFTSPRKAGQSLTASARTCEPTMSSCWLR